jgi:uncharacterized protein YcnI
VTVRPGESRPAELQRYSVLVPNEGTSATTSVRMQVPKGIDTVLIEPLAGWDAVVVRKQDRIAELRWSGGSIEPDQYQEFHFIARNPVMEAEITWPTLQAYAGGKVVRWIGPEGSDEPAPRVDVKESATPVDVVSTHGEAVPAGAAPPPAQNGETPDADPAAKATDEDDDDGNGLAIVALIVGALGLVVGTAGLTAARRARRAS